jgi:nucleolar MIF4G domain-containing protein 1
LEKLTKNFEEKDVECILHMLRNVGFNLRKDNPMALKNLILSLQKQASGASDEMRDNSRVKFMLDVLLAIKNNNVTKIPNYDTSYSEHLKKIMKGFIRKGNYVTQLNISLEDLLKGI